MKIDDTTQTAWARLLRVERQAHEAVDARLKAADLPPLAWYDVLLELDRADAGLRQYEIGERMLLSKHNLSRLLDRLQQRKLIRRTPCPEDGRASIVTITAAGRALRQRMWPVYAEVIDERLGRRLNEREQKTLAELLGRLMD